MLAPRRRCTSKVQLISSTNDVIKLGGEGIILRAPNSMYESGRSSSLVKLKVTQILQLYDAHIAQATFEDQEALVTCVFENNDLELKLYGVQN